MSSRDPAPNAGDPDQIPTSGAADADLDFFDSEAGGEQSSPNATETPTSARSGAPTGRQAQSAPRAPTPSRTPPVPAPPGPSEEADLPVLDLEGDNFQPDNGDQLEGDPQGDLPTGEQPHPTGRRNTEGLPPEIAAVVSNMSNKAWATLEPLLREHQTMRQERYADHPEGYMLAPEYQDFTTQYQQVTSEHQFALSQLQQAKAGEQFYVMSHDDSGKPVRQGPFEPTTESIAELEQLILDARGNARDIQKAAVSFKEGFTKTHKAVDQRVNAILEPVFKPYADKLDKQLDAHFEKMKIPNYVRQRSDLRNTGKLLLLFQFAMKEIGRLSKVNKANGTAPIQQGARRRTGPANSLAITEEDEKFFESN